MPRLFDIPPYNSVLDHQHPANYREMPTTSNHSVYRTPRTKPFKMSLGWELEANHRPTRVPAGVLQHEDGSVDGHGAEFVIMPSVVKSPKFVLGTLKELVHAPELNTNKSCGFHVHIGAPSLTHRKAKQWAVAVEYLAKKIEEEAFKAVPDSRSGNNYCRPIHLIYNGASFNASKYNNDRRYHWLNIVEMFRPGGIRTIEFRLLGHTHRWKYLLAWTMFCMELGRRGSMLLAHPFEVERHVTEMKQLLKRIEEEIKPLERKHEPIPQWVYDGFKVIGIDHTSWDRPLAKLYAAECETLGRTKKFYSDNQATIDTSDMSDDCACGCGSEGRCDWQRCEDGECSPNECERCHENGNCDGSRHCYQCQQSAHSNGDNCERQSCRRCNPAVPVTPVRPANPVVTSTSSGIWLDEAARGAEVYGESIVNMMTDNNRIWLSGTIHPSNRVELLGEDLMTSEERSESELREMRHRGSI